MKVVIIGSHVFFNVGKNYFCCHALRLTETTTYIKLYVGVVVTEEEKSLGNSVRSAINATQDFEAYFAESVHDLSTLGDHIFKGLQRCSGAISFLHKRGSVINSSGENWGIRSSVWVNQEIAILAFRQFLESETLPILVFKENSVKLEGAMTSIIVNPLPLVGIVDTIAEVKKWLETTEFAPCLINVFEEKWNKLSLDSKKALSCLICEGGVQVKEINIWRKLKEKYGFPPNTADDVLREAKLQFIDTGLVNCIHNINTGDEMTLHPTWKWYLRRAVRSINDNCI